MLFVMFRGEDIGKHRGRRPAKAPAKLRQEENSLAAPMIERPLLAGGMRESPRNDFEREVRLQFRDLQRPVSATSQNISATGMFIRSRDTQPAGSTLSFELSLGGTDLLIRGEGEVAWARVFELGVGHPAGMGIRFLDLGQESHRALRSLIAGRNDQPFAGGGVEELFDPL